MLASNAFTSIINQIRMSNLNYQLQLSPFSAYISLKQSLIKERSGAPRLPPAPETQVSRDTSLESVVAALVEKNLQLERKLEEVQAAYTDAVDKLQENNIKKEPEDKTDLSLRKNEIRSFKL